VLRPTVAEMARRGEPFCGLLYAGLALTADGPRVVEFNARFGDPETEVVLPLLEAPLGGLLHAAATGRLAEHPPLRWRDGAAVTVVVAAAGYPAAPRTGDPVTGADGPGVLHAGTALAPDGSVVSAGGRVLAVTAVGADLAEARQRAYERVAAVRLAGAHWRTDIALAAVEGRVVTPR
jgi:phosphoribosylamine--glycine ligase